MKIKKGDQVKITTGQDKGKKGKVLQVFLEKGKISIEGHNLQIKHTRPKRENEKGQRIQYPSPIAVSKVRLICPKCNKPTRVGYKILKNKKKMRRCVKCNQVF